jgi:cell wall-associated NlpC family hydrolase
VRILLLSAALLVVPLPSLAQTVTNVNGVQVISGNDPAPKRTPPKPARAKGRSTTRATTLAAVDDASPIADLIVQRALAYRGVPYVWGGTSPRSGFDCSGFVQYVYATVGIRIPRTADAQFAAGRFVPSGNPEPGDLVFFQTYDYGASHVGIYIGGGQFVVEGGSKVHVATFNDFYPYFRLRYLGARRLIPS